MKVNLSSTKSLEWEFHNVVRDFHSYHDDMKFYLDAYKNNVYFPNTPNSVRKNNKGVNFLQIFADKLWDYLSEYPKVNVPSLAEDQTAETREKIILSTDYYNQADTIWVDQMFDAVVMSCVITFQEYDFQQGCVKKRRIDPRRAYWKRADANSNQISAFWYVEPMTKDAIKDKYNVTPTTSSMTIDELQDLDISPEDENEYFSVITRVDDNTMVRWVGDRFLIKAHNHQIGAMPVDIAFPFNIANYAKQGDFYMRKLLDLQAEFNRLWAKRANILRRMASPVVWGRGIKQRQFDPTKEAMSQDGGFIGLTENGELGLLTIPETKMIDNALNDIFQRLKDVAGFPTATFGESVGANTSGDALGMYFQPTQRMVNKINTHLKNHLQSANSKTLRLYDRFMVTGEPKTLYGYVPKARIVGNQYEQAFNVSFTKEDIAGNYYNVVTMSAITPKDDVAYKRLMLDSAREGVLSKVTALSEMGFQSPQDEMNLLEAEQGNPTLNPDGASTLMNSIMQAEQSQIPQGVGDGTQGQY